MQQKKLTNNNLEKLKNRLSELKIDYFLQPNSDEFFSEYLAENEKRIEFISSFSGSNAVVIFSQKKSFFFTDGRYLTQAKNQLSEDFEILDLSKINPLIWIKNNLKKSENLAYFKSHLSINFVKNLTKISAENIFKITPLNTNPIDEIWHSRAKKDNSEIFLISEKIAGKTSQQKRSEVIEKMTSDLLLISSPLDVCWLLNIRSRDDKFTPIYNCRAILFKDGSIDLFHDNLKTEKDFGNIFHENDKVNILSQNFFDLRISNLAKNYQNISLDEKLTNSAIYQIILDSGLEIILQKNFIEEFRAIKNDREIFGMIEGNKIDGLMVTKFIFWLKNNYQKQSISETSAAEKLLDLRKKNKSFFSESFSAISGFAENSAIIHYHANDKTNKNISGNSLYLIDSGGQYLADDFYATTDITRTIAIGKIDNEMIDLFTRVLKGHIAIAKAKFKVGTTGKEIDILARQFLFQKKLDYPHSTGHGVGSFLSVHEGPCGISAKNDYPLKPNMIISNEPGFYLPEKFGIRIENLLRVIDIGDNFLSFETISLAPIDIDLIDFKMLTYPEKKWLKDYHQKVFDSFKDNLNEDEKNWLYQINYL
jgi:Xaa-Pro aminopeptidase